MKTHILVFGIIQQLKDNSKPIITVGNLRSILCPLCFCYVFCALQRSDELTNFYDVYICCSVTLLYRVKRKFWRETAFLTPPHSMYVTVPCQRPVIKLLHLLQYIIFVLIYWFFVYIIQAVRFLV